MQICSLCGLFPWATRHAHSTAVEPLAGKVDFKNSPCVCEQLRVQSFMLY